MEFGSHLVLPVYQNPIFFELLQLPDELKLASFGINGFGRVDII